MGCLWSEEKIVGSRTYWKRLFDNCFVKRKGLCVVIHLQKCLSFIGSLCWLERSSESLEVQQIQRKAFISWWIPAEAQRQEGYWIILILVWQQKERNVCPCENDRKRLCKKVLDLCISGTTLSFQAWKQYLCLTRPAGVAVNYVSQWKDSFPFWHCIWIKH